MVISRAKSIFGFLLILLLLNACSGNKVVNVNSSVSNVGFADDSNIENAVRDDIEELGKIIKLPAAPEEAAYSETKLNNRANEKRLVAVLKFSAADASQIVAQTEKYASIAPQDVEAESWFPPELVAKSQETGDGFLKGKTYAANDFLQPPYLKGRLTRINDTNYFVLELFSF